MKTIIVTGANSGLDLWTTKFCLMQTKALLCPHCRRNAALIAQSSCADMQQRFVGSVYVLLKINID